MGHPIVLALSNMLPSRSELLQLQQVRLKSFFYLHTHYGNLRWCSSSTNVLITHWANSARNFIRFIGTSPTLRVPMSVRPNQGLKLYLTCNKLCLIYTHQCSWCVYHSKQRVKDGWYCHSKNAGIRFQQSARHWCTWVFLIWKQKSD